MDISSKVWWTRNARIQTEKRLLNNAFHAQLIQLWYSFFSVSVAVYYLSFEPVSDKAGPLWVIFSILILVVSGFISGQSYKERAALLKECYEALSKLHQKIGSETDNPEVTSKEYDQILAVCENHTDRDYHMALCYASLNNSAEKLDKAPNKYIWLMFFVYHIRRFTMFFSLYALPCILLSILIFQ